MMIPSLMMIDDVTVTVMTRTPVSCLGGVAAQSIESRIAISSPPMRRFDARIIRPSGLSEITKSLLAADAAAAAATADAASSLSSLRLLSLRTLELALETPHAFLPQRARPRLAALWLAPGSAPVLIAHRRLASRSQVRPKGFILGRTRVVSVSPSFVETRE